MSKNNHQHSWEAVAYFFDQGDTEEWLVIICFDCEAKKVIKGFNQRDGIINIEQI